MDRRRFILVLGADPAKWAARYGLTPGTAECYSCNAPRTTSIPFFAGPLRGLVAPTCACGNDRGPYCVVAANGGDVLAALPSAAPKPRRKRARKRALRLVTP